MKDEDSRELTLLIPCIVLGTLLLVSLICIAILLLRAKGKYGRCEVLRASGQETAVVRCRHHPGCEVWKSPVGVVLDHPAQASGNLLMVGRIFPGMPSSGGFLGEADSVLGVGEGVLSLNPEPVWLGDRK